MVERQIRKIIHVDMDAFYASVEQRDDPALRGKPLAVGSPRRGGVVLAASYQARAFGVRSALPSVTAQRQCPELVFVPPRFDAYKAVSRQVPAVFAEFTDVMEPVALDEAYLEVTSDRTGLPTAWATAKAIRARILAETGLTASAGVSYSKFLAKIASGYRKPDGQFAIVPEQGETFMAALPVAKFHGVGPKTAARMHALGIVTGADLLAWPSAQLERHFGRAAGWYQQLARGQDNRPVRAHRIRKSTGSETTFDRDCRDPHRVEMKIAAMADDVWDWCEKTGGRGRTVTVKIKWADFQRSSRSQTLAMLVESRARLREISLQLIRSVMPVPKGIRLEGVTLSNFGSKSLEAAPELVFEDPSRRDPAEDPCSTSDAH